MADRTIYDDSMEPQLDENVFTNRQLSWVQDLNGNSYTGGFINIDSSTLSSSGRWIDWKSAYIEIPFIVGMQASTSITSTANGFMAGLLKGGNWNLINSMSVDFQNTNIVQQTPFLNFFVNYKVLSSWSQDNLRKYGSTVGLEAIDTPSSMYYSAGAGANGNGISNNQIASSSGSWTTNLELNNTGLYTRAYNTSYSPVAGLNSLPIQNSSNTYNQNVAQNLYATTGSGASTIFYWSVLATIRLKDVCPFFEKCPLLKKGFFRLTIGYNAVQSMSLTTTTAPNMVMSANPTMIGNTNPVMVLSSTSGNPLNAAVAAASNTLSFTSGIGTINLGGSAVSNPFLTSCRLYVYSYLLEPEFEKTYIEVGKNKEIIYDDIYNYNIIKIGAGNQFNSILSNTMINPKEVIVVPMINSASNGTAALIPYQSPFDTAPMTTCPLGQIYNFQIIVSGDNLWQQAELYDFDQYLSEVSPDGALNGGQTDEATSGLLSQRHWQFGYRYYVGNVGRRLKTLDGVPRSITVQGTNNSNVYMDYICFITFQKKLIVDVLEGEIRL